MAADWIKMRSNLASDPRVGAMADELDAGEATVIGACFLLWAMADQHSSDGSLPGMTKKTLDRRIGLPGFADALERVGWLEATDESLVIPEFEQHLSQSAKRRAEKARSMSARRKSCGQSVDKNDHKMAQVVHLEKEKEKEKEINPLKSPTGDEPSSSDSPKAKPYPAEFEDWWAAYPKKAAKENSLKAFTKALSRITTRHGITKPDAFSRLMRVTRAFANSPKGRGEFCPHPSTWLNQGCYEDDPAVWRGGSANASTSVPAPTLAQQDAAARQRREQNINHGNRQ